MFSSHTPFSPKSVFRNFLLVAAALSLFSTTGCGGRGQQNPLASNPAAPPPGSGSSASAAPAPPPPATPPPPTTPAPAPTPAAGGAHGPVILVVEENHGYSSAIGSGAMPYLNSLAAQNVLATQY